MRCDIADDGKVAIGHLVSAPVNRRTFAPYEFAGGKARPLAEGEPVGIHPAEHARGLRRQIVVSAGNQIIPNNRARLRVNSF